MNINLIPSPRRALGRCPTNYLIYITDAIGTLTLCSGHDNRQQHHASQEAQNGWGPNSQRSQANKGIDDEHDSGACKIECRPVGLPKTLASKSKLTGYGTAQNSISSPLLRLPAELRTKIWEFAYGDQIVEFSAHKSAPELDNPDVINCVAASRIGPGVILHLRGRATMPRPICKQYWSETSQAFFASATFEPNYPEALRALALSAPSWLQFLRRLVIVGHYSSPALALRSWTGSLTSSLLGRFISLEGIVFDFAVYQDSGLFSRLDVLNDKQWKKTKLPTIIRAIQQHQMKPKLTTFTWKPWVYGQPNQVVDPSAINEVIRIELLKHHPRRVSRRGKHAHEER